MSLTTSAGLRVIAGAACDIQTILHTADQLESAGFTNRIGDVEIRRTAGRETLGLKFLPLESDA